MFVAVKHLSWNLKHMERWSLRAVFDMWLWQYFTWNTILWHNYIFVRIRIQMQWILFWRVTNLCISLKFSEHASVRYFQLQITEGNSKTISNNAAIWFAEILAIILSLLLLKSFDYLLVRGALYDTICIIAMYDIRLSAAIDLMHIFFSLFVQTSYTHEWELIIYA